MLKNKNINIILALIIAVSLWAYVIGDINPKTDVVIKDVPINFENKDSLSDLGLVILNYNYASVNVTVTGPRTEVTKVSKDDFKVMADVEGLTIGSNVIRLDIAGPDNVKISDVNTEKISVNVDEWVSEVKDIEVVISGNVEGQKEPLIIEKSKESVNVSGAKSLVKTVEKVNAVVEVKDVGNEMKTLNATLQAVNANGDVVDYVYLDSKSINVTTIMHHKKTVNLEVPVENESAGGYERTVQLPKTIVIKGEDAVLSDIETITCKTIDLSKYTENASVAIEPLLPTGIEVSSDSGQLYAEVKVKPLSKATIKVAKDNITIKNASDNLKYDLDADAVSIEVEGNEAEVAGLSLSDFTVYVDVKGLESGTHTVELFVETDKNLAAVELSKNEIDINIE